MTHQEILTKAIEKAIASGWDVDLETVLPEMRKMWSLYGLQYTGYNGLLFSKDFAKALWGDKLTNVFIQCPNCRRRVKDYFPTGWQYHLQKMVIAEDPIAYLGEHLA